MRKLKRVKKFSLKKDQRKALFKILAYHLIMNGKIKTTTPKAKYLKQIMEKLISKAKKGDLASLRYLIKKLPKKSAYKLFYEIAPKYQDRTGGYLRVIKLPFRRIKDNAELAIIEFV
ncbi:MAG: 50S ribosomal protein L17 [Patescibacteria group bacterium]